MTEFRPHCRPGRSCVSGARRLRRPRRERQTAGARTNWRNLFWLATGPRPDCPRRLKARCDPATARRRSYGGRGMSDPQASTEAFRRRRGRCSTANSPTATGASSSRPTAPSRPNTCCCAIISASRSMPSSSARSPSICGAPKRAHGGWPLFQDGDFDMSASVKAYFALKMIGDDIDAPHMARARRGMLCARRRGARQRLHPDAAGAVRLHSVARGAGDAGRDHAAAEVVSVPSRQDFVLEPHRHRAAAGADGAEAAGAQSEECPDRRAVPRAAGRRSGRRRRRRSRRRRGSGSSAASTTCCAPTEPMFPEGSRQRAIDARGGLGRRAAQWRGRARRDLPAMANSVMMFDALGYPRGPSAARDRARSRSRSSWSCTTTRPICQPCVSPIWDTGLACHALLETGDAEAQERGHQGAEMA